MHQVDLSQIESVEALYQLIGDAHAEIARREEQERETMLANLEELAKKYGKSVEAFLNLNAAKPTGKRASGRKAARSQAKETPVAPVPQPAGGEAIAAIS